jgi:hypothetical protein
MPSRPNRNFSGREIVVRQQDRRARIDHVLLRPTEVVVKVSGEQLHHTSLTLGGAAAAPTRLLSQRTREVHLPLTAELGSGAWLALHRDRELLDRRILDPAWGGKDFEVEVNASTRVEMLISHGEQATIEFKRQLPGNDPAGVMKTVAAFANGVGGSILFGVEDDGEIVGIASTTPAGASTGWQISSATGYARSPTSSAPWSTWMAEACSRSTSDQAKTHPTESEPASAMSATTSDVLPTLFPRRPPTSVHSYKHASTPRQRRTSRPHLDNYGETKDTTLVTKCELLARILRPSEPMRTDRRLPARADRGIDHCRRRIEGRTAVSATVREGFRPRAAGATSPPLGNPTSCPSRASNSPI